MYVGSRFGRPSYPVPGPGQRGYFFSGIGWGTYLLNTSVLLYIVTVTLLVSLPGFASFGCGLGWVSQALLFMGPGSAMLTGIPIDMGSARFEKSTV